MRHFVIAFVLAASLIGCIRTMDDPDKVAHEFTEALINGQAGTAMLYTPTKDRGDPSFRSAIELNAKKLAPCKEEKHDYKMTVVNEERRLYRIVFSNLCGSGGFQYTDLALRIDKVDGRWLVTDHAPQMYMVG